MLSPALRRDWQLARANQELRQLAPDEAIELALRSVKEGVEPRAVLELAGEPFGQPWRELNEPFEKACESLGLSAMDSREAVAHVIFDLAKRVIEGKEEAMYASWRVYSLDLEWDTGWGKVHAPLVHGWLNGDWDDEEHPDYAAHRRKIEHNLRLEFAVWLRMRNPDGSCRGE